MSAVKVSFSAPGRALEIRANADPTISPETISALILLLEAMHLVVPMTKVELEQSNQNAAVYTFTMFTEDARTWVQTLTRTAGTKFTATFQGVGGAWIVPDELVPQRALRDGLMQLAAAFNFDKLTMTWG